MEGNLEWLKFRDDWFDVLLALSKPEMDRLLTAIREFTNDREVPEMSGRESFPWILIKAELEKDKTSRRKAADAHREAGTKGGRPKADKTNLDIEETKKTKKGFEKPNENDENQNNQIGLIKELRVKEIKSTEVKDINCADAHNSQTKTEKLTPDDHDFWKFAKDNAELAETFYKATGIYPVKSQFGRWVNDCNDLAEAEINVDRLQKTIAYMQSENIPLSAPGSCLKTAQWLKSRGGVPVKSTRQSQQKPKYNAFELLTMRENGIPVPEYDIEVSA